MNFQKYLEVSAEEINQELDNFFQKWSEEVLSCSSKLSDLNNSFIQANIGGKRLRGTLVKLGYEIAKNRKEGLRETEGLEQEILKPAAAFEIFQTAILAHDDVIDKSVTRRGKPTLYQQLGGNHYGISQTICLGDIGFFLAEKLINDSDFPVDKKNKALVSFIETMLQTGLGQMLDVKLSNLPGDKNEGDILTVFRLKTARYTLVGPMQLGAILGGANDRLLGKLREFGESLGIAFQIQDDILGIFGSEETLGKSVISDIEEGKVTLLLLYAKKHASRLQQQFLEKNYGKGKIGIREVREIRDIFQKTGALEYSQRKAEGLVKDAKKIIPLITKNYELKTILEEMADFLVNRQQ